MTDTYRNEYGSPYEAQSNATGRLFKSPAFPQKPGNATVGTLPAASGGPASGTPPYNQPGFGGWPGQSPLAMPGQMPGPASSPAPNPIPAQPPFRQTYTLDDVEQAQSLDFISTQHTGAVRPGASAASAVSENAYIRQVKKHPKLALVSALCLLALFAALGYSALHILKGTASVTLYRASTQTVTQDIGGGGTAYPAQRMDIAYPFTALVLSVFVKPGDKVSLNQPLVKIDLAQVKAQRLTLAPQQAESDAPALPNGNIVSNITGTVTAVNIYPGQLVSANKIMLTIFDESSVIVRVKIPLINYNQVHTNQPATITPAALPNVNFNGTVMAVIQNVDTQTDTFEVWIKVLNTSGNLLPGMSAFVQLQENVQTIAVPRLAVLNPDRDSIVFIERNQHVYIQHVQVLGYSGDTVLIGSGLSPNDLIVLVGLDSLQDGQEVRIAGIENQAQ